MRAMARQQPRHVHLREAHPGGDLILAQVRKKKRSSTTSRSTAGSLTSNSGTNSRSSHSSRAVGAATRSPSEPSSASPNGRPANSQPVSRPPPTPPTPPPRSPRGGRPARRSWVSGQVAGAAHRPPCRAEAAFLEGPGNSRQLESRRYRLSSPTTHATANGTNPRSRVGS
jgi:hypothetical protein